MSHLSYPANTTASQKLTLSWLLLGLSALIIAGLYSIMLVASRTPGLQQLIPFIDFFHTALVVHVDMSVMVWFLAFAAVFWSYFNTPSPGITDWTGFILAATGTGVIAISPFTGDAYPLINNYIPVLQQQTFFIGLCLFGAGFSLRVVTCLLASTGDNTTPFSYASWLSSLTALIALLALLASRFLVDSDTEAVLYYELLFWGAGHGIQFTHTVLVLACWFLLVSACRTIDVSKKYTQLMLTLAAIPSAGVIVIYLLADNSSGEFRLYFTELMRWGGLLSLPMTLLVLRCLFSSPSTQLNKSPLQATLYASLLLFLTGGVLGFMIRGINVVIPAHYHGSIVGITLAYMGVTYYLLPHLGFRLTLPRLATWQAWIYASGQMMHIIGLAWSGGYGVQRKTAGAAQGLERLPEIISMGMMGMGGLIAIIGGTLFLIVALHALLKGRATD